MSASPYSSNVILAKARAMYGRCLSAPDFHNLLACHSVSEIAQEVGFGDASNFSTRFAKATGQSPLQYRKSALKPVEGAR